MRKADIVHGLGKADGSPKSAGLQTGKDPPVLQVPEGAASRGAGLGGGPVFPGECAGSTAETGHAREQQSRSTT